MTKGRTLTLLLGACFGFITVTNLPNPYYIKFNTHLFKPFTQEFKQKNFRKATSIAFKGFYKGLN